MHGHYKFESSMFSVFKSIFYTILVVKIWTLMWYIPSTGSAPKIFILHRKYFRNLRQSNNVVLAIISAVKQIEFHLASTIVGRISWFGYVIYSSAGLHCWQHRPADEYIR